MNVEVLRTIRYGSFALIALIARGWAAVGLGILVMIYRNTKSTDIALLKNLKN